jgi:hypothetical protein
MRWSTSKDSDISVAYSGEREIGSVGPVACTSTPRFYWRISDVAAIKDYPAVSGECASLAGARAAFRRAWKIWLAERRLVEASP